MIQIKSPFYFVRIALSALLIAGASGMAKAEAPKAMGQLSTEAPRELKDVGIQEKLGDQLDLGLKFKNEDGQEVSLASFYDGKHPVVISLIYFSCPGLCNFHLNGVIDTLKTVNWSAGNEFQYLVISFEPKDTPLLASQKKENYMKAYGRPGTEKGWHFLTADEATIKKITSQIGFQYKWVPETNEWAHASAAIVTTPKGKISRYLHGILFEGRDFKLALSDATEGRIGTLVDRMVWYCFHYDPKLSKYTLYAANIMKVGGVLIILILAAILIPVWIRSYREQTVGKRVRRSAQ